MGWPEERVSAPGGSPLAAPDSQENLPKAGGRGYWAPKPLPPSVLTHVRASGPTDPQMFLLKTGTFHVKKTDA